jgi:hypothetical protein
MKLTYLLFVGCLLVTSAARAQTAPPPSYEFLTVLEYETQYHKLARLVFAPAFQGKSEIELESLPGTNSDKYTAIHGKNLELINKQLEALTVAGWELVHVSSDDRGHEYLFRRRKP